MKLRLLGGLAVGAALAWRTLRPHEPYSFAGKVVLITGGSRGLGLVLARQLAAEGAKLALLARTEAELEQAAGELREQGTEVLVLPADVRERQQVEQAISRVIGHYGALDVLVNNAGIIQVGPSEHMQVEDYENAMGVHLWGPLYAMQAAIPHMKKAGGGRIVNIASIGGLVAIPHLTPYSASKHALVGLSDGLRAELAKDHIQVTTVCPGLMRTGSHYNALFKGQQRNELALFALVGATPLTSISAEGAATQIVRACRNGDPHLTITIQARILDLLDTLVPGLWGQASALVGRLLPGPTTSDKGNQLKTGWDSQSPLVPSPITILADQATDANNELRGHAPVT